MRISIITIAIFCLVYIFLFFLPDYKDRKLEHKIYTLPKPIIFVNKSALGDYPPSSKSSILAITESQIDGLHINVFLSKDNQLVVLPNQNLEEHTRYKGHIKDYDLNQLTNMKRLHKEEEFEDIIMPLDAIFSLVGGDKIILLELNENSKPIRSISENTTKLVKKHKLYNSVIVSSSNPLIVTSVQAHDPEILTMWLYAPYKRTKLPKFMDLPYYNRLMINLMNPDIIAPEYTTNKTEVQRYLDKGYPVISWNINDTERAKKLAKRNIVGIKTDQPIMMRSVLFPNEE